MDGKLNLREFHSFVESLRSEELEMVSEIINKVTKGKLADVRLPEYNRIAGASDRSNATGRDDYRAHIDPINIRDSIRERESNR
ncbi:hypothetical protein Bb109J_c1092 [Bdellovibrio bacteriovorus]|nr:hypothetical protein Bb109J_c1092 [Bdellovibrio bacteriovorus]